MSQPVRARTLRWVIGTRMLAVMLVMLAVAMVSLQLTLRSAAMAAIDAELDRTHRSCRRFLDVADELLLLEADALAEVAQLKATMEIADVDSATLDACLRTLRRSPRQALLLLTDPELRLLADADSGPSPAIGRRIGVPEEIPDGLATCRYGEHHYRVALRPVCVGEHLLGYVVVGRGLENEQASELRDLTDLDVLVISPTAVLGVATRDSRHDDSTPLDAAEFGALQASAARAGAGSFAVALWNDECQAITVELGGGLWAVFAEPTDRALAMLYRTRGVLLWTSLAGAVLAMLTSAFSAARLSGPLRDITTAADRVAAGDLRTRVPLTGTLELQALATTFNGMVTRIDELLGSVATTSAAAAAAKATVEVRTRLLANLSHELRTPMNGVLGMCELLAHTKLDAEQGDQVAIIRKSADSMLALINHILDFAKADAEMIRLEQIEMDLPAEVEDVVDLLAVRAHQKGLEINCLVAPDVPAQVRGDPGRLRQILTNLLGNAVKFTVTGEVGIAVEIAGPAGASNTVRVRFCVHDTGIGISKLERERVYEPFVQADASTTRKFGGTGLGLAISRMIVERMGGTLDFDSTPGAGSTFRVEISFEVVPRAAPPEPLDERLRTGRILCVDDSATTRRVLQSALAPLVRRVDVAATAADAMKALIEAADAEPYTLAIVDQSMPGNGGLPLAAEIRSNAPLKSLPVLWLTAGIGGGLDPTVAGVNATLRKPIRRAQLLRAIDALATGTLVRAEQCAPSVVLTRAAGCHVLLVEDNFVNQRVASSILRKLGCRVDVADNGRTAVAAAAEARPDLILMDCNMPEMDGYQATRAIRAAAGATGKRVPIIALTANSSAADREACLAAGMDDFVSKPVRIADLRGVLDRWLRPTP